MGEGWKLSPDWDLMAKKSMCRNILERLYGERKILLSRGGVELARLEYEWVWLTGLCGFDISVFLDAAQICLLLFPPHATADFLSHLHDCASFLTCINLKTSHNLKIESYVLFGGNFWDLKPRRQHLEWPWENCSKKVGAGVRLYLQQGAGSLNTKDYC